MSRLERHQILEMFHAADLLELGMAADARRQELHPGDTVTFIIDRNINYTNICTSGCGLCAFYRKPGDPEGYVLSAAEVLAKVGEAVDAGATQVMLQGGLNPGLDLNYYLDLLTAMKRQYPVTVHSFSPAEILFLSRQNHLPVPEILARLRAAGLDSLPGGGAEILDDAVRRRVSPDKISADDWLDVMRQAQRAGLKTTATMVIGFGETVEQRLNHFEKIRQLQDETGGFRAFIIWSYQPGNTALGGEKTSSWDYLRTLALARLYFDNIPHLQGSWVTQGEAVGQVTLAFGANDLGSVMLEENVVRAAGTSHQMSVEKMIGLIRATGKIPAQRDTAYHIIKTFEEAL